MTTGRTIRVVLPAVLAAIVTAGCSATAQEPEGLEVTFTATPGPVTAEPSEAPGEETADVAEIESAFAAYWDAVIESENGPISDPDLFAGVAVGAAVETQLTNVNSLINDGIRRIGAPILSDPIIHLDGDTARVEVCVDSSTWGAAVGDHTAPPQPPDPKPRVVDMERIDDRWLVTDQINPDEATITC